jgi:hypothetical protein
LDAKSMTTLAFLPEVGIASTFSSINACFDKRCEDQSGVYFDATPVALPEHLIDTCMRFSSRFHPAVQQIRGRVQRAMFTAITARRRRPYGRCRYNSKLPTSTAAMLRRPEKFVASFLHIAVPTHSFQEHT